MNTDFNKLFKVSILHSYFDGDICTCLQFSPSAVTLELLQRYQFKISDAVNGFGFYSSSATSLSASLGYIKAATGREYFEFDLLTSDPAFYCFTDLPVNWTGRLLYDSASVTQVQGGNTLLLTGKLSEPETTMIVGNLKVRFDDLVNYTVAGQPVNFEISYAARATQWQYYVVNRNSVNLDNASVKGKDGIVFENSGSVTIETGESALLFTSGERLIPLSRFPKHRFDLVNNLSPAGNQQATGSRSKTIIKGLPIPDPLRMGTVQLQTKSQVSSPIYIYV